MTFFTTEQLEDSSLEDLILDYLSSEEARDTLPPPPGYEVTVVLSSFPAPDPTQKEGN